MRCSDNASTKIGNLSINGKGNYIKTSRSFVRSEALYNLTTKVLSYFSDMEYDSLARQQTQPHGPQFQLHLSKRIEPDWAWGQLDN